MAFIDIKAINPKEVAPGFHGRFVHGDNISVAHWEIKAGSSIPAHQHVHEMIVNVISGKLELTIGDEVKILESGMGATIPSNIPHRATALTDCYVIDVFHPVRADYVNS